MALSCLAAGKGIYLNFLQDSESAILFFKEVGVEIDDRQLASLKKLDYRALEAVAKAFGDRFIT